ncbi:RNA polymerase sigma-70 factor, ECF subfamily [Methylomarinovum caldicuralii]|uniref:RNA polymerase sigma-70 factor, ECF subfamily n=1 Tax=Methylomarinovum caldicuralii TaxID=438856 RepID=A0AAU9BZW5_9GAMM|nr:sigma-70 family RNA polymerase sigma factor [Methylomarinovum caldicuralii]BCX81925.1 RNA polymerase sigma-70 factor, ECF subfamily [Methylomarinovum caldicuralii]
MAHAPDPLADPDFIASLRGQMLRFATLQLSDPTLAEDTVQEALAGALKNADRFQGRAAFKTWVFAILRHKIADALRQRYREAILTEDEDDERHWFDDRGHWRPEARPWDWGDPAQALNDAQFWRVFETCLERLPPRQAQVFMMREFIGLETKAICATLNISATNLNVLLHRARLRLQACLENHWFAPGGRHAEL